MSGAFVFQGRPQDDLQHKARLLAGQLAHGGERVNHYTVAGSTLLGCVSHDKFRQGFMPRFFEHDGIWGILLGELYDSDFLERRKRAKGQDESDLEVFVHLYREGALARHLPEMNGAFFVLLWHPERDTLVAANDRFGLYPMYWSHRNDAFCLASRVLCSVLSGVVEGEWDAAGVAHLLTIEDFVGETTLVKGVSAFPQATLMVKRGPQVSWERYWRYKYTASMRDSEFKETAEELGRHLVRAVRRQSVRVGRVGVTLSGGLDSRCLVAAAGKVQIPVHTFTWAKENAFDRVFARQVAELYGTRHHDCDYAFMNLDTQFDEGMRLTEGLNDYFDCHMLAHLHILADHTDLVLNGYAGDLVLGGSYLRRWMRPMKSEEIARRMFAWRNKLLAEPHLEHALVDPSLVLGEALPSARFRDAIAAIDGPSTGDVVDRFVLENRVRRVTSIGTVIMQRSVESVAPFFDYDFIDLVTTVPAHKRIDHIMYLEVMRATFPEALDVPWQRTLLRAGASPLAATCAKGALKVAGKLEKLVGWPNITSRQSPVDIPNLIRGPLRPWMERLINEPHYTANEVLHAGFCKTMWQEHLSGHDRTRMLGAIAAIRGFSVALKKARNLTQAFPSEPTEVWPPE